MIGIATLAAVAIAFLSVPFARRAAFAVGAIDRPNPDVRTHVHPTPLLGGVAIVAGAWLSLWIVAGRVPLDLALSSLPLLALGAWKDISRNDVPPSLQLAIQLVACLSITIGAAGSLPVGAVLTAAVGGVALINAINFLDVADGLCATVSTIVALGLYLTTGEAAALTLAASCAGFWLWNRPRATIFMGDLGSFFIGLSLYDILLRGVSSRDWQPLLLAGVPAFELAGTIVIRSARSRSIVQGDASHPSLLLLNRGTSPWTLLLLYAAATLLTLLLSGVLR